LSAAIEVSHLHKAYGAIKAVNDISFSVAEGEIFGMLGPNGAGKTTTMEIVEGLHRADSGAVSVMGMDVRRQTQRVKELIGVQLQTTSLYPRLTVSEVLGLFRGFFKQGHSVDDLIELSDLEDSRRKLCRNLSGGQQQRLSIALALVNNPRILFLDEPTTGLDPQARHNIWNVINLAREQGKTVFLTTHYMDEAEKLCDRVAIVDRGKIIALNSPANLIAQSFHEQAIEFDLTRTDLTPALEQLIGVKSVAIEDGKATVYSALVPETVASLLELSRECKVALGNLSIHQATLEDVFLKLTGRRIRE
jgi:ABC-2 type transport system ATP-binding protein